MDEGHRGDRRRVEARFDGNEWKEGVNAMAAEGTFLPILLGIHIHPSLSEIVPAAIGNAQPASAVQPG